MTSINGSFHALLLLSDSALPLGSFAFSSGLESFLAHHRFTNAAAKVIALDTFLEQSISNVASTALPYVFAAYNDPNRLEDLDNALRCEYSVYRSEASEHCSRQRHYSRYGRKHWRLLLR